MSTETDYISRLSLEVISNIFAFLDIDDLLRCLLVSNYFYSCIAVSNLTAPVAIKDGHIYKCDRSSHLKSRLRDIGFSRDAGYFLRTFLNGRIIDEVQFHFGTQQSLLSSTIPNFISIMDSYRVMSLSLKDCCNKVLSLLVGYEALNNFSLSEDPQFMTRTSGNAFGQLPLLRHLQLFVLPSINLNRLQRLAVVAPNLESLQISSFYGSEFSGTEPFDCLKTFSFSESRGISLGAITSFIKTMPNLTALMCPSIDFGQNSEDFFNSLPSLEYLHLDFEKFRAPITCPAERLIELHIDCKIAYRTRRAQNPLPHVGTFGFGFDVRILHSINYYVIGRNLKTLWYTKENRDFKLDKDMELWKGCPNIENLYAARSTVRLRYLVQVAGVCTKLRLVSFHSIKKIGRGNKIKSLLGVGIKDIYLSVRMAKAEVLVDNGVNVYMIEAAKDTHLNRRYGYKPQLNM